MDKTEEWRMVVELHKIKDELPEQAEDFIINLYENIDPYAPFFQQLIGLPDGQEKQMKWLYSLYEKFCNQDPDTAQEIWDDE